MHMFHQHKRRIYAGNLPVNPGFIREAVMDGVDDKCAKIAVIHAGEEQMATPTKCPTGTVMCNNKKCEMPPPFRGVREEMNHRAAGRVDFVNLSDFAFKDACSYAELLSKHDCLVFAIFDYHCSETVITASNQCSHDSPTWRSATAHGFISATDAS